ncbi:hypothetical protein BGZ61DRAFT_511002 [Ilyonectria robusta]|uniref:uncharacterized protein n=1 Tax=Ilyonectria robusta TaxID=1079257 RepID=UPI001E8E991F|nr:uncharacterized protein BGZ61DRAFT_511002 [Ilyonectria robusta]KAH8654302.1 hypothetical protein BGZ61DRAFT_511002 [Ilyonectria robusta]
MRCTLVAIGQTDFAQALLIWRETFANDANGQTLTFILERKSDLALFLIGLIEPANSMLQHFRWMAARTAKTHTGDTTPTTTKSLSHIFLMGKQNRSLDQLPINTTLRSDFGNNGTVILPPALTIRAPENTPNHGEQWLFVNGIGGEYFWLRLYCEKLRDIFNRDIRGVFNRSDGILWDLIECAGERAIGGGQNTLIERTPSSMAAQGALSRELSAALQNEGSNGYIVMIAYSQGCLLLRLVLQKILRNKIHGDAMRARLRVFTFGNPSIDWMGTDALGNRVPLCEHVNCTEHFANERDFVAQLGVLRMDQEDDLRDLGYLHEESSLFINRGEDWIGHLFGTQYSLRSQDYVDGDRSRLFACAGGTVMAV